MNNYSSLWALGALGMMSGGGCGCRRCNNAAMTAMGAGFLGGLIGGYLSNQNQVTRVEQPIIFVQAQQQNVETQAPVIVQQQATQPTQEQVGSTIFQQEVQQAPQSEQAQQQQLNPYNNNPNAFIADKTNFENYANGKDTAFQFTDKADISTKEGTKAYTTALEDVSTKHIADGDANKDGSLDIDEFTALDKSNMESLAGEKLTDEQVQTIKNSFNRVDVNGDGKADKQEIATYYSLIDSINGQKVDGKFTYDEAAQTNEAFGTNDANQQKGISDAMKAAYQKLYGTDV